MPDGMRLFTISMFLCVYWSPKPKKLKVGDYCTGALDPHGRVRYRLNALYRSEDYFRGDFTTDTERFFVAPTITAKLSDRTDLTINLEYRDDERANDFGLIAIGDQVADIPFDRALNDPDLTSTSDFLRTGYQLEHRFSDAWKIRNSFHFTDYDTSVIVGLGSRVFEDTGIIVSAPGRLDQPTDSFELQTNVVGKFSTGFVDHTLLTGVDLYRREDDGTELRADLTTRNILNIFNPDFDSLVTPNFDELPLFLSSEGKTDNIGVYLQDQVTLLDNLKLLVGFRYDSVYQDGVSITRGRETITDRHDDAFSPRVGIVYQPIEPISLFTSYSRSFAPNFGTTVAGDILEPERGTQFEFGVKAELLEGDLSVNLAYFDLTKQNVSTADPNNIGFAIATGEQRSRGLELDVIGELLPGWNMIGNYAYTSTEITEDNSGLEGNELFGVPEHNFNLWSTYTIQRGAFNGLGFGFGLNYVAERFGDNANSFSLDPYVLTNAALFYRRDNWQTSLNFRNLFDVDYIESAENRRTSEINPGEGFTVIGSMSIQF
jgi:iron complex outermembrane receptor protein